MKIRLLMLNFLFFAFVNALLAVPPSYIQTKDGVIVFTEPIFTGTSKAIKLEVVSDNIIRVIAAPRKEIMATQSLVIVYAKKSDLFRREIKSQIIPGYFYNFLIDTANNAGIDKFGNKGIVNISHSFRLFALCDQQHVRRGKNNAGGISDPS